MKPQTSMSLIFPLLPLQSEALGLFANLGEYFTEWSPIITEKRLLSWLEQHLKPGTGPLDIQLAAILVLRSVAAHTDGSRLMVESGILRTMVDLLRAQQEDDEFVLQVGSLHFAVKFFS
jgi:Kinesin-associated protein (KAP)